jgi:hypothetical protein
MWRYSNFPVIVDNPLGMDEKAPFAIFNFQLSAET